jgi:hypothetical protein
MKILFLFSLIEDIIIKTQILIFISRSRHVGIFQEAWLPLSIIILLAEPQPARISIAIGATKKHLLS